VSQHDDGDQAPGPDDGLLFPPLDGHPGPARLLPSARAQALARAVVERALAGEAPAPEAPAWTARRGWRRASMLAAAAAILLSVAAAAAAGMLVYARRSAPPVAPPPVAPRSAAPPAEAPPPSPVTRLTLPEQDLLVPAPERPVRRHEPGPRVPRTSAPHSTVAALEPVDVERAPAEDLLSAANERRREREWTQADRLYQAVIRRFPHSDAGVVALVASASLHLEQLDDASGALRDFRQALASRPEGTLAEEARWGIAMATRALGDRAAEAAALDDFLAHHPTSALAPVARRRQAERGP
jgi:Tetratricopeptide repeat